MFDTLECAHDLQAAGFERGQAEAQVRVMGKLMTTNFATKDDMKDLRQEFVDLRKDMLLLEQRMTIKMGAMSVGIVTVLAALMKLMH